jgi:hypothetical protein
MTRRIVATITTAALVVLGGCGGSSDSPEKSPPKTTEVTKDPLRVSLETACNFVFLGYQPGSEPFSNLIEYVGKDTDEETKEADKAKSWNDELKQVRDRAPEDLAVYLDAVVTSVDELLEALDSGGSWEAADFKSAGTEVLNQCDEYVPDNFGS